MRFSELQAPIDATATQQPKEARSIASQWSGADWTGQKCTASDRDGWVAKAGGFSAWKARWEIFDLDRARRVTEGRAKNKKASVSAWPCLPRLR